MSTSSNITPIPSVSILMYEIDNFPQPPVDTQDSLVDIASSDSQRPQLKWPSLSKINRVDIKIPFQKLDPKKQETLARGIPQRETASKEIKKPPRPTHPVSSRARQILKQYIDLFPQETQESDNNTSNAPIPYQPSPTPQQFDRNRSQANAPVNYSPLPSSNTRYPPIPSYYPNYLSQPLNPNTNYQQASNYYTPTSYPIIPNYPQPLNPSINYQQASNYYTPTSYPIIPNYPQPLNPINSNPNYQQSAIYYTPTPPPVAPNYPQPPRTTIAVNVVNHNVVNNNNNNLVHSKNLSEEQRVNIERFNKIKVDVDLTKFNSRKFVQLTERYFDHQKKS